MKDLVSAYEKRQQWFISMIGKRVYRPPLSCKCPTCIDGHVNGILVSDEMHADYLHACESEMRFRYSDKPFPV